jgi:hypothetical protein
MGLFDETQKTFAIGDDSPAIDAAEQPANEIIIEGLPKDDEEQAVHDQLPDVEEAKANLQQNSARKSKRLCLLVTLILGVIALTTAGIIFATKSKSKEDIFDPTGRSMEGIVQFLYDNKISTLPDLHEEHTAQYQAALFIADSDAYQMELTKENSAQFVERYVLALLYYHFKGPEWNHQLKFLDGTDHCDWWEEYSSHSGETVRQGVQCNEDGDVVELDLGKSVGWHRETKYIAMSFIKFVAHRKLVSYYSTCRMEQSGRKSHSERNQIPWSARNPPHPLQ